MQPVLPYHSYALYHIQIAFIQINCLHRMSVYSTLRSRYDESFVIVVVPTIQNALHTIINPTHAEYSLTGTTASYQITQNRDIRIHTHALLTFFFALRVYF